MRAYLLATVAVAVFAGGLPGRALAQSDTPSAGSAGDISLGEVVVTAQRREENLQRAAIAITSIGAEALTRAGVTDVTQLTAVAPSLQVGTLSGPYSAFYLRGVGNFTTNALSDSAVAFSVDGVSFARSSSNWGVFYDLDRVEVLKGPQGTLYGKNATGGAINVITTKPVLGETFGYGVVELGNYEARKFTGGVNVPLGDSVALRLSTQISRRDGYYTDGSGDDRTDAVRATLKYVPNDDLSLIVSADYAQQGGEGTGGTYRQLVGVGDKQIGLRDPRAQAITAGTFVFLAGSTLAPINTPIYQDNESGGIYGQLDYRTSLGELTVLSSYRQTNLDFLSISPGFANTNIGKDKQFSTEVRLASSGDGPLSYIAGAYYLHESTDAVSIYAQQFFGAANDQKLRTTSGAVFGRLTYAITDDLRVTGGARYTSDEKKAAVGSVSGIVICPGSFATPPAFCFGTPPLPEHLALQSLVGQGGPPSPWGTRGALLVRGGSQIDTSKTFRKATWRAAVEYDVAPQSMVYASVETGFKAGGFFVSIDDPTYQPETITAYTLGSKNRFFDNRVQVNVEAFLWRYKDQQVSTFRSNRLGGTEFVTQNVGETEYKGVDIDLEWLATSLTRLSANLQYLDAKNTSFTYQSINLGGPPATGCAAVLAPSGLTYTVNCTGFRPVQAPEWANLFSIGQTLPIVPTGKLVLNARTRYQSKTFTGLELLASEVQKSYWTSDVDLTWTSEDERIGLTAFVNNIEDTQIVNQSVPHPRNAALVEQVLRPPRTYGVRLRLSF